VTDHETVSAAPELPASGSEGCIIHPFEAGERICHRCGHWHCEGCIVLPWGPRKPALCVSCAIGKAGVRRGAGQAPARSARDIRRIEKEGRRESREAARRPVVVTPHGMDRSVPLPVVDEVPRERRGVLRRLGLA